MRRLTTMLCVLLGSVIGLAVSLGGYSSAAEGQTSIIRAAQTRPNLVFILTDDLSMDLVQYMPHVLKMQADGLTFSHAFVTDSLCCPSRSSIFTGQYPHNTGIFTNGGRGNIGEDGGYLAFLNRGHEQATFAIALSAAGYRTAMLGKYLNGYDPLQHGVAPGWTEWSVAGNAYASFDYDLNHNGAVVYHGIWPDDYVTDVLSASAITFIKQSAGTPFMIEVATFAPHLPFTPAPRDADALPGLKAPRTQAFNAAVDQDGPDWLKAIPALNEKQTNFIDLAYRKRVQSVLAVDKMIGDLQAAVASIGQLDNTYFIFSSDNGFHMGEYRLTLGKMTAYDTDIHVPLVIVGPGVKAGQSSDAIVENIDLCPTFIELAGAVMLPNVDGRSLAPFLRGETMKDWRTVALIEHHGPVRDIHDPDMPTERGGNPTTYEAIRTLTFLYVEYSSAENEYHALTTDPGELHNSYNSLSEAEKAMLHKTVARMQSCRGAEDCLAAERFIKAANADGK